MEVEEVARRRYISTRISHNEKINKLAMQHGDFHALFYTWGIPHANEDATLKGNPGELRAQIVPWRTDKTETDVEQTLTILADAGLILWDKPAKLVQYPIEAFYEYQTNVTSEKRRTEDIPNNYQTAKNSTKQQRTAKNASSSSLSSSLTLNTNVRSRNEYPPLFEEFWSLYPRNEGKKVAFKAWSAREKEGVLPADLIASAKNYAAVCKRDGREARFIMMPVTFLGPNERWKDYFAANKPQSRVSVPEDEVTRRLKELM